MSASHFPQGDSACSMCSRTSGHAAVTEVADGLRDVLTKAALGTTTAQRPGCQEQHRHLYGGSLPHGLSQPPGSRLIIQASSLTEKAAESFTGTLTYSACGLAFLPAMFLAAME